MDNESFLTAEWRHLAMINYEVDPAILHPYLPQGTELDRWQGKTLISIVGFHFLNTRVMGLQIPFHDSFEEINLRFYVRRRVGEGWRRGVVFIREIVPRWAIAAVARIFYNENYVARPMRHRIDIEDGKLISGGAVEYSWLEGERWNRLSLRTKGDSRFLQPGSEEEFITEHYWGYSAQRDGGCIEYQVEHPSWRVWQASDAHVECDVERVYGRRFAECLSADPTSAFAAEGSPVIVRRGARL